jgi:hypothetical protein
MDYNVIRYGVIDYNIIRYHVIDYNICRDFIYTGVCIYSAYSYYCLEDKMLLCNMLLGVYTLDLFFHKETYTNIQYIMHHSLILLLFGTFHYYKYYDFFHILVNPALSFQISTIFLNLNKLLEYYNINQTINLSCFIVSFFYYRLYRYYYDVIINNDITDMIENTGPVMKYCYYSAVYNLYALNMYWFSKILKIILKKLR